ncbi:M28 family peptidase [Promethearchaeum syntrophicum]|uniref:M28 family peptidase n=1 Tax=Promethearchaeum syntrophicum TaxID=2594042 RepID=A0A5B9DBF8_9ARCH
MKSFEKESVKILEIAKELSFPRMMGSKGEKDAQIYIFSKLKKLGCNPIVKNFNYYYNLVIIEKGIAFFAMIFFATQFFLILFNAFVIAMTFSFLLLILSIILIILLTNLNNFKFGKQHSSKNMIYTVNSEKHREFKVKMGLIIINANYDSIGRKIRGFKHSNQQKALLIIGGFSFIISFFTSFIGIRKLHANFIQVSKIFTMIGLSVSIFTSIIYFLNRIDNSSKGAVDNASGCAVLFNLIQRLNEGNIKLDWMDLQFLFSGAKEIGAWGINSFLKESSENFGQYKDVYLININRIGAKIAINEKSGIFSYKKKENSLVKLIEHLAYREKIHVQKIHPNFYINKIFLPLNQKSFEICSLTSPNKPYLHTAEDNTDKIDQNKMRDVSELIFNAIISLDQKIGDKIDLGE